MVVVSTRNSQQQQQQKHHLSQQQQQRGRSASLIVEPKVETVMQLPIQPKPIAIIPIQAINEHFQTAQSQNSYQHKLPDRNQLQSVAKHIQSQSQFQFRPQSQLQSPFRPQSQSQSQAQSQAQSHAQSKDMKVLLDLINRSNMPVNRRRRKSRRQRKVRNHLEESGNWPNNQLTYKGSHPIKSTLKPMFEKGRLGNGNGNANANANGIAYAISLSENNKSSSLKNLSNHSNQRLNDFNIQSGTFKIWSPVKAENVLEAPFATSTSAGQTQMIIISSSRTISTSTDRTGSVPTHKSNTKHRKETQKERPALTLHKQSLLISSPSSSSSLATKSIDHNNTQWKNKYNIDYDNKLEDEYEIIMKDE